MYDCGYCRDTCEDPEHHLTVDQKVALDAQQIGPGDCPACRPHQAPTGAIAFYSALDEAERRALSGGASEGKN